MGRKLMIISLCLFILSGCENKEENEKNEYITTRTNLLEKEEYTSANDLPLDITVKIDREDLEQIKYKVILNNTKENMNQIKAMVVHNYYSEDIFPSIGIFNDKETLLTSEDKSIELEDTIETTKNISKLNLELKIWLEYKNDNGETKEIFYKTTYF